MANLTTHYKEINPKETVQRIQNFFTSHNFNPIITESKETEAGTWYSHIDLFSGKILILSSNGKGMTEDFSLASGFAELYERFCNKIGWLSNSIWAQDYITQSKKERGYYFHPRERILTYNEAFQESNRVNNYFTCISNGVSSLITKAMDAIVNKQYIGVPITCLDKSNEIYIDPRVLLRITRSGGMAAGNTLNEALVQGISELLEHEVSARVYANFDTISCYALNLDNIKNESLKEKIDKIISLGYKLYLIDLSYTYNLPVMMSILIDPEYGTIKLNFGAFPVFDIAAERVITELYQGINSFKSIQTLNSLRDPYKTTNIIELNNLYANSIDGSLFPANFILNLKYKEEYNHNIYAHSSWTNDDFIQYYIGLMHNTTGMKIYYIDNSLTEGIYAIQVMIENTNDFPLFSASEKYLYNFQWNELEIQKTEYLIDQYLNFMQEVRDNTVNIPDLIALLKAFEENTADIENFLAAIFLWSMAHVQSKGGLFDSLLIFLNLNHLRLKNVPADTIYAENNKEYKKYLLLVKYLKTNKYNAEELKYIFNNIFNYNITDEDLKKSLSTAYLLQKAYIEPLLNYINSEEYSNLISTYMR